MHPSLAFSLGSKSFVTVHRLFGEVSSLDFGCWVRILMGSTQSTSELIQGSSVVSLLRRGVELLPPHHRSPPHSVREGGNQTGGENISIQCTVAFKITAPLKAIPPWHQRGRAVLNQRCQLTTWHMLLDFWWDYSPKDLRWQCNWPKIHTVQIYLTEHVLKKQTDDDVGGGLIESSDSLWGLSFLKICQQYFLLFSHDTL